MLGVRYLTLLALVIWVGGLVTWRWLTAGASALAPIPVVGGACGLVMFVGLLVLKFVGPPPRAFFLRLAIVVLMTAAAVATVFRPQLSDAASTLDIALGCVLLFWYVKE